ncbi:Fis family transcriptional regulator [Methanoculleus taiwanensis]|uniref:Fis family transcriptional regulator n=1 Tax=Methanoculleus taiwanensis TaxID=1550565 RepID=A0A498H2Y5_9EURY|nr:phosphomannomutase/phosphoglucomutase [Methanoculleus taiwanensis]RXE56294.1 Fis family transcriptional regulator [Methanoculleus taiwanensis]
MGTIFKAYDIRGAYPDELDEGMARRIGAGFARLLQAETVVVGRDMRLSSPSLAEAFIEGALAAGASVVDIGMVSTPLLYHAIIDGGFDGGAMVTASHLPGRMNGFKLCRAKAIPLSGDAGLPALERLVAESPPVPPRPITGPYRRDSVMERYIGTLVSFVRPARPLKVVVDAGSGMAGPEVPRLAAEIPAWTFIFRDMEPDGRFPDHIANPLIPATTRELQAAVVREQADIGVAFDGDADRCGFIDEAGNRVPEDLVTALIARVFLQRHPGATILYDLRSSRIVPETIRQFGGRAVRCRVGHAFIKAQMREEEALFAGELSGHYYYRDTGYTDNAVMTMIQLLNLLSGQQEPLSRLVAPLKKYASTGEINIRVTDKDAVLAGLEERYGDAGIDHLDGLTVEYPSWWFNIRPSQTEPVLRLNLEAWDEEAMEMRKRELLAAISKTDPAMRIME